MFLMKFRNMFSLMSPLLPYQHKNKNKMLFIEKTSE
jgi:hypothetical protein